MNLIVKRKARLVLVVALAVLKGVPTIQTCHGDKITSTSSAKSSSSTSGNDSDSGNYALNDRGVVSDRIVQSLFRFPATQLGPEFNDVLQNWYTDFFHIPESNITSARSAHRLPTITPEPVGIDHAFYSVSTPAATIFRRQCYGPAPTNNSSQLPNLYDNFEQRRKKISFEFLQDPPGERIMLHKMTKRFYSAFLNEGGASKRSKSAENEELDNTSNLSTMHKKKSKSTINTVYAQSTIPSDYDSPSKLSFKTNSKYDDNDDKERRRSTTSTTNTTQSWTWQTPGLFSERGSTNFLRFRQKMYYSMRAPQLVKRLQRSMPSFTGWESGRQSGMFWYPPGGVREWHTNRYDLGHEITKLSPRDREVMKSQVWRMYFVRTVREDTFDTKLEKLKKRSSDGSNNDHSGMHIIPGEDAGLSLEVLRRAGARPLTTDEKERQWSDEFAEDYAIPSSSDGNNGTIASNDDDGKNSNNFDRNTVWRVPDHDGYVTLFRLPNIWHCIISEEVHRFSLGFAFSEKEVQALLTMAGVDFDVAMEQPLGHDENHRMDENDEL